MPEINHGVVLWRELAKLYYLLKGSQLIYLAHSFNTHTDIRFTVNRKIF